MHGLAKPRHVRPAGNRQAGAEPDPIAVRLSTLHQAPVMSAKMIFPLIGMQGLNPGPVGPRSDMVQQGEAGREFTVFAPDATADPDTAAKRCPALGFMLLAALWCVLFFSLSGCKLPTYILPAFPFLALAIGTFLARTAWPEYRSVQGLLVVGLLMQLTGNYLVVPWWAGDIDPRPALVQAGYGLRAIHRSFRRDGAVSVTLYQLEPAF